MSNLRESNYNSSKDYSEEFENGPQVSNFLYNDVYISKLERPFRVIGGGVPENDRKVLEESDAEMSSSRIQLKTILRQFISPWISVQFSQERYGKLNNAIFHPTLPIESFPDLLFEIDMEPTPLNESQKLLTFSQMISSTNVNNNEMTTNFEEKFQQISQNSENWKKEQSNFKFFDFVAPDDLGPLDTRPPLPPISRTHTKEQQWLFECIHFDIGLGKVEPYFFTFCLYDIEARKKITESFSFDYLSKEMFELLGKSENKLNPILRSKQAVISLPEESTNFQNYVLLCTIEKVLQGDIGDIIDNYVKFNSLKKKETQKINENVKQCCTRLGSYRQLLAFGFSAPVFDSKGNIISETYGIELFAAKDDFVHPLHEEFDEKHMKQLKSRKKLSANVVFKAKPVPSVDPNAIQLTSSLNQLISSSSIVNNPTYRRELLTFFQTPEVTFDSHLRAHHEYRNLFFVYPISANYSPLGSAKNVAVKIYLLDDDSNPEKPQPLECIFSQSLSEKLFCTSTNLPVFYHTKKPSYYSEIKILLPSILTDKHHLRFDFYQIHCKPKKKETSIETLLGHTFLRIMENNAVLKDDVHELPLTQTLVPHYLSEETKWIENKKPLFYVRTLLESTIFTHMPALHNVLSSTANDEQMVYFQLHKSLSHKSLDYAYYFPSLMNRLWEQICEKEDPIQLFSVMNDLLFSLQNEVNRQDECWSISLLEEYAAYDFVNPTNEEKKCVFFKLCLLWLHCLLIPPEEVSKLSFNASLANSWQHTNFFFRLMVKSMALYLHATPSLDDGCTLPFSPTFRKNLHSFIVAFSSKIKEFINENRRYPLRQLNIQLALFFKDILHLIECDFVFALVQDYLKHLLQLEESISTENQMLIASCRFEILAVISEFEHYKEIELELDKNHYISKTWLNELKKSWTSYSHDIRLLLFKRFRNFIRKLDLDPRYTENDKSKLADRYLSLVFQTLEHLTDLEATSKDEKQEYLVTVLWIIRNSSQLYKWLDRIERKKLLLFFQLLNLSVFSFQYAGKKKILEEAQTQQSARSRNLSISSKQRKEFIEQLYKPGGLDKRERLRRKPFEPLDSNRSSLSSETSRSRSTSQSGGEKHEKKKNRISVSTLKSAISSIDKTEKQEELTMFGKFFFEKSDLDIKRDAYLSTHVNLSILKVLEHYVNESKTLAGDVPLMRLIVNLIVTFLESNQIENFLEALYSFLCGFLATYSNTFFHTPNNYCSDLTFSIIRLCTSRINLIRDVSTFTLYFFIKKNFTTVKNFNRMKRSLAINISKLGIEESHSLGNLNHSLYCLISFAKNEFREGSFTNDIEALVKRLSKVLQNSQRIFSTRYDNELTIDLVHNVYLGYSDSPELQITWLENLFHEQVKQSNWEEAAQAKLILCSLVIEFMGPSIGEFPTNKQDFAKVCPNVMTEHSLQKIELNQEEEIVPAFTSQAILDNINSAVNLLKKADMFELSIFGYNILMNYHQANRNFEALYTLYQNLTLIAKQLIDAQKTERIFPRYYRVAFFGQHSEDFHLKEYIYKQKPNVLLSDLVERISNQLKLHCSTLQERIEVVQLPNTSEVDVDKLDSKKLYYQIISVQPYFDGSEKRTTAFDQIFNIKHFYYDVPFTKIGSSQTDDVTQQYKKKIILSTELVFPYYKTRIPVVSKKEFILSPIENAIDLIKSRSEKIKNEIKTQPPNIKSLQNILQGSVSAQVNAGPLLYLEAFLQKPSTNYSEESLNTLFNVVKELLDGCHQALKLNETLIKSEQLEFHQSLVQGFQTLMEKFNQVSKLYKN